MNLSSSEYFFNSFFNICGDPFALWMLIVTAGGAKCLISASQGCSEGETRPAMPTAACAQTQKPVTLRHMCHAMEDRYFLPLTKTQSTGNAISEVKGRSCGFGEG